MLEEKRCEEGADCSVWEFVLCCHWSVLTNKGGAGFAFDATTSDLSPISQRHVMCVGGYAPARPTTCLSFFPVMSTTLSRASDTWIWRRSRRRLHTVQLLIFM